MELLTIPEVRKITKLGLSTLYQKIERGELPVCRFGRAIRVPRQALEAWIQSQMSAA